MIDNPDKQFVIFGSIYIDNGKSFIYPIAIYDNIMYNNTENTTNETEHDSNADKYRYFSKMFTEIKRLLCYIIQGGINSFDMYEQIKEYSAECGKTGLLVFSQKLDELYGLLTAKNHTYSSDNSKIISVLSEIFEYITIGIRRTEYNIALDCCG